MPERHADPSPSDNRSRLPGGTGDTSPHATDTGASPTDPARQAGPTGQAGPTWRSLEELAQTPEFLERLQREFPQFAARWPDDVDRREFLKLMAAPLALAGLAGLAGCNGGPRTGELVPYIETPEELIPGRPLYFATAMTLGGYARGLVVKSHMGRPIKIEGNAEHPASLGATDVFAQAAVLSLYDPERAQAVRRHGRISTWAEFTREFTTQVLVQRGRRGAGLRLLTETVTSPTLAAQIGALLERFPEARWHQYDPVHRDNARVGALAAFGQDVEVLYHLDRADVILALDDDLLATGPAHVRYARDFARARSLVPRDEEPAETGAGGGSRNGAAPEKLRTRMNRLYVVESTTTLTGATADHRLPVRPPAVEAFVRLVAQALGLSIEPPSDADRRGIPEDWITAVVSDLRGDERGGDSSTGLVTAGPSQPPAVHALAHAINAALGSAGTTVTYTEPVAARSVGHVEDLAELAEAMRAGAVDVLVIIEGNPAFTAPADIEFGRLLREHVPHAVHLSDSEDETSAVCRWHVPQSHFLESWTDARAFDGTATICQPLIAPLYDGRTPHELLSILLGEPERDAQNIVRAHWQSVYEGDDFETFWRRALHDGIVAGTASGTITPTVADDWSARLPERPSAAPAAANAAETFDVALRPDPRLWDGRFANNAWLHELPRPLSKVSWDNPAYIGPADASRLELVNGDVVELSHGPQRLMIPVWVLPGQPEGVITVTFGGGREHVGRIGRRVGFDGYRLRTAARAWSASGVALRKTGERHRLVSTQEHFLMNGRHVVRTGTFAEVQEHPEDPHFMHVGHGPPIEASLYPDPPWEGYQWGMAIDQSVCIGCNACVVACQAENNIPVVGKDQVHMSREMHWLRIDTYYEGPPENPATYHQPMLCVHCEKAPCEVVCPVTATAHSSEGLNDMVYNRCVGTRYCSNNCPYKVRRFNFLDYRADDPPTARLLHNPDVTVRSRGVMEKCTFCVQRINAARIDAEKEGRAIRDGEIVTACQAACPSQAIQFGNLNADDTRVLRWKQTPLNYGVLAELNVRPRATHLAAVRNPHPRLARS